MTVTGATVARVHLPLFSDAPAAPSPTPVNQNHRPPAPSPGPESPDSWHRLWARTAITGALIIVTIFGTYELIERSLLVGASPELLHLLHIVRGSGTAVVLGTWAFLSIMRTRRRYEVAFQENLRWLEREVAERTHDLEQSQALTELLFDSLRGRVIVTDREGRVVKANRMAREAAGTALDGRRCLDVFPECAARGVCLAHETFEKNAVELDKEIRADASGRLWSIDTYPVRDRAGAARLVMEVGRDVTEQKSMEAQLRHQEKMASLGMLAAGIAHDVGNPLASISSELELLDGETDPAVFQDSLRTLGTHVERISRTLREIVDFARRRRDEVVDVCVYTAVADSVRLLRHDARMRRVALVIDVPRGIAPVRMVEDHLVFVLLNLMINAVDAMPEGGTLTVRARALDTLDQPDLAELTVEDTGTGMTDEVRKNALKPLFTTKEQGHGTGLGLSVSHDVVRSVGGTLEIDSAPGRGTRVILRLPLARGGARG